MKVQIWDSAGQERYDTIIKPYYREAQAFILVFDLTNRQTFDEVRTFIQFLSRVLFFLLRRGRSLSTMERFFKKMQLKKQDIFLGCNGLTKGAKGGKMM